MTTAPPADGAELAIAITAGGPDCKCAEVPLEVTVTNNGKSDAADITAESATSRLMIDVPDRPALFAFR